MAHAQGQRVKRLPHDHISINDQHIVLYWLHLLQNACVKLRGGPNRSGVNTSTCPSVKVNTLHVDELMKLPAEEGCLAGSLHVALLSARHWGSP